MTETNKFIGNSSDLDLFFEECINDKENKNILHINNFLKKNNLKKINEFEKSYCIETKIPKNDKKENKIINNNMLKSFIISLIFYAIFLLIHKISIIDIIKNCFLGNFLLAIIFTSLLFFILFEFKREIYKYTKIYKEKVKAICIGYEEKLIRKEIKIYRPFYYLKYNNLGYILINENFKQKPIPKIGDITDYFFINKDNPLEYTDKTLKYFKLLNVFLITILLIIIMTFFKPIIFNLI